MDAPPPVTPPGPPPGAAGADPGLPPSGTPDGPPPAGPGGSFFAAVRRLGLVRTDDRWVGGVAGGFARRLDIDPLLVRGLFVVSLLLGGLGLMLYGVAWALLPEERDGRIHLEQTMRGDFDVALLGAIGLVVVGIGRGDHWLWWNGEGWLVLIQVLATVGLVVALVAIVLSRRRSRPGTPAGYQPSPYPTYPTHPAVPSTTAPAAAAERTTSAVTASVPDPGATMPDTPVPDPSAPDASGTSSPADTVPVDTAPADTAPLPPAGTAPSGTATYGPGAYTPAYAGTAGAPPVALAPPVPPRPQAGAAWLGVVTGLTLLTLAGLMATERAGWFDGPVWMTTFGVGIVLLGAAIVIAGLRGRTSGALGGLAVPAVILGVIVALVGSAAPGDWWAGGSQRIAADETLVITTRDEAQRGFSASVGDAEIDLTRVPLEDVVLSVPISMGAGDIEIVVPRGAAVTAEVTLGAGEVLWELTDPEQRISGVGQSRTLKSQAVVDGAEPQLHLVLSHGAGTVTIEESGR